MVIRSDLIQIFKIMKGMYDVNKEIFFNWMTAVEENMSKNCLKRDLGPVAPTPLKFKWDSTPDLSGTQQRTRCTKAI